MYVPQNIKVPPIKKWLFWIWRVLVKRKLTGRKVQHSWKYFWSLKHKLKFKLGQGNGQLYFYCKWHLQKDLDAGHVFLQKLFFQFCSIFESYCHISNVLFNQQGCFIRVLYLLTISVVYDFVYYGESHSSSDNWPLYVTARYW